MNVRIISPSGFLLLELVLAMLIISIALVGLIDGFRTAFEAQNAGINRIQAQLLLERKVEDIENQGAFSEGASEGEFPDSGDFAWKVISKKADLSTLWRLQIVVVGKSQHLETVVYLREKQYQQ